MSLSISAASPVTVRPPVADLAGGAKPAPAKTASASTTDNHLVEETSALNRVLGKYRSGLAQGEPTAALASLARQITDDAKLLGQSVQLPKAPAASAKPAAPPAETSSAEAGSSHLQMLA